VCRRQNYREFASAFGHAMIYVVPSRRYKYAPVHVDAAQVQHVSVIEVADAVNKRTGFGL
jgi:hypothetical protein